MAPTHMASVYRKRRRYINDMMTGTKRGKPQEAPKPCHFYRLPAELHEKIFDYVFTGEQSINFAHLSEMIPWRPTPDYHSRWNDISLRSRIRGINVHVSSLSCNLSLGPRGCSTWMANLVQHVTIRLAKLPVGKIDHVVEITLQRFPNLRYLCLDEGTCAISLRFRKYLCTTRRSFPRFDRNGVFSSMNAASLPFVQAILAHRNLRTFAIKSPWATSAVVSYTGSDCPLCAVESKVDHTLEEIRAHVNIELACRDSGASDPRSVILKLGLEDKRIKWESELVYRQVLIEKLLEHYELLGDKEAEKAVKGLRSILAGYTCMAR